VINEIIRYALRFIALVLLQVVIVQNIYLGSYVLLYPFVLFILLLPFEMPKLLVMVLAFVTGLTIDVFYSTAGMQAAACTFIGFSRHYVLKYTSPRGGYEAGLSPTVADMGITWFVTYSAVLILLHHFSLFFIEVFRFSEIGTTLLKAFLSTIGTFIFVYILQFLFYKADTKKQ
jgi:hypothetical protein